MLTALIDCFGDDSWPVRDATCIAAGAFVRVLPEVTKPMHEALYAKFLENCTDPIASVRQGTVYQIFKVSLFGLIGCRV